MFLPHRDPVDDLVAVFRETLADLVLVPVFDVNLSPRNGRQEAIIPSFPGGSHATYFASSVHRRFQGAGGRFGRLHRPGELRPAPLDIGIADAGAQRPPVLDLDELPTFRLNCHRSLPRAHFRQVRRHWQDQEPYSARSISTMPPRRALTMCGSFASSASIWSWSRIRSNTAICLLSCAHCRTLEGSGFKLRPFTSACRGMMRSKYTPRRWQGPICGGLVPRQEEH